MTADETTPSSPRSSPKSAGRCWSSCAAPGCSPARRWARRATQLANAFLMHALRRQRPDDGLLSEEERTTPRASRTAASGSSIRSTAPANMARRAPTGRCTSRWRSTALPRIGAVALPGLPLTLRTDEPAEPCRPQRQAAHGRQPHPPGREAVAVAEALGAELVPMGSAGAKAMAIVRGEADIYLHSGGQYEWDSCAPVAVAQAARTARLAHRRQPAASTTSATRYCPTC